MNAHRIRFCAGGFTLIELMVIVAVIALMVALAGPSFGNMLDRRRIEETATELFNDLQYARSQALADNRRVQLVTSSTGYSIASTTGSITYRTVATLPSGISVTSPVTVLFSPQRGCLSDNSCAANDLTLNVESASVSGQSLRIVVNNMGRVRLCSPSGSFKGYTSC